LLLSWGPFHARRAPRRCESSHGRDSRLAKCWSVRLSAMLRSSVTSSSFSGGLLPSRSGQLAARQRRGTPAVPRAGSAAGPTGSSEPRERGVGRRTLLHSSVLAPAALVLAGGYARCRLGGAAARPASAIPAPLLAPRPPSLHRCSPRVRPRRNFKSVPFGRQTPRLRAPPRQRLRSSPCAALARSAIGSNDATTIVNSVLGAYGLPTLTPSAGFKPYDEFSDVGGGASGRCQGLGVALPSYLPNACLRPCAVGCSPPVGALGPARCGPTCDHKRPFRPAELHPRPPLPSHP
jgi:hypothetical protein